MSFWLRLCLGCAILAPSLTQAAVLEIPGDGDKLSGIGVISGWKCEADGDITARFDGGPPLQMVYESDREDTRGACGDANNGFLSIFNWSLLSDGEHTARVYDNGVEFAASTFEVATIGEEFLAGANVRVRVPNFPSRGKTTWFEWNEGTQNLHIDKTVEIGDVCDLIELLEPPTSSVETPLLQPPPLPCPRDREGDFDGDGYYIQFDHDTPYTEYR